MPDKPDDEKPEAKADDKPKGPAELKQDEAQQAEDVRRQEKPDAPLSVEQRAGAGVNVMPGDPSAGFSPSEPSSPFEQMKWDAAYNPAAQPSPVDPGHLELAQNERMAKVEQAVAILIEVINELGPWVSDIWHSTKARTKLMGAREHMLPHLKETPDQYSVRRSAREPIDLPDDGEAK